MLTRQRALTLLGAALLVSSLEVIGELELLGTAWPPLSDVWAYAFSDVGRPILGRALESTLVEAGYGLVVGTVVAVAAASLAIVVPVLEPGFDRVAAIANSIPLISLGPVLITTVGADRSPVIIAGIGAGFAVFVATTSGLNATSAAQLDLFAVLGSSRVPRLFRLQFPTALPFLLDGVTLGAPAAVLGAIIGEWFGAPRGVGVVLISSMQNAQVAQLWAAALACAVVSLLLYAAFNGLGRYASRRYA